MSFRVTIYGHVVSQVILVMGPPKENRTVYTVSFGGVVCTYAHLEHMREVKGSTLIYPLFHQLLSLQNGMDGEFWGVDYNYWQLTDNHRKCECIFQKLSTASWPFIQKCCESKIFKPEIYKIYTDTRNLELVLAECTHVELNDQYWPLTRWTGQRFLSASLICWWSFPCPSWSGWTVY